jgi:hypothetical protein
MTGKDEEPDCGIGELGRMNCLEFERVLPDYLEGGHTAEQQEHLSACSACASLLADLNFISSQAGLLQDSEDPSPAVWNALEVQLRREGLIHGGEIRQVAPARSPLADFFRRRRSVWLVPVAAALLIAAGLKLYQPARVGDTSPVARISAPASAPAAVSSEDQQVLNTMASRFPAQQARYRRNLEEANSYIRDAEQSIKNDPNDVYSRELLINAYEQKQMLYDLAVNRTGGQ